MKLYGYTFDGLHITSHVVAIVALFIACFAITGYITFRDRSIPDSALENNIISFEDAVFGKGVDETAAVIGDSNALAAVRGGTRTRLRRDVNLSDGRTVSLTTVTNQSGDSESDRRPSRNTATDRFSRFTESRSGVKRRDIISEPTLDKRLQRKNFELSFRCRLASVSGTCEIGIMDRTEAEDVDSNKKSLHVIFKNSELNIQFAGPGGVILTKALGFVFVVDEPIDVQLVPNDRSIEITVSQNGNSDTQTISQNKYNDVFGGADLRFVIRSNLVTGVELMGVSSH